MLPVQKNDSPEVKKEEEQPKPKTDLSKKVLIAGLVVVVGLAALALVYEVAVMIAEVTRNRFGPKEKDLESAIINKFGQKDGGKLIRKVKKIEASINYKLVIRRMSLCSDNEKTIFIALMRNFTFKPQDLERILKGSHFRLLDEGQMYNNWKGLNGAKTRFSSHPSTDLQYSIQGPLVSEFLFSQNVHDTEERKITYTWVQLEGHPVCWGHIIRHTLDYFRYKMSGWNQGPFGASEGTHYNPYDLNLRLAAGAA